MFFAKSPLPRPTASPMVIMNVWFLLGHREESVRLLTCLHSPSKSFPFHATRTFTDVSFAGALLVSGPGMPGVCCFMCSRGHRAGDQTAARGLVGLRSDARGLSEPLGEALHRKGLCPTDAGRRL